MIETTTQPPPYGSQQFIDWVNLLYHQRIAELLRTEPERVISKACSNLARWLAAHERGSADARCLEEWEEILARCTVPELIAILTEDSDEGQRLRSSTPFTGLLSAEEQQELTCYEEDAIARSHSAG